MVSTSDSIKWRKFIRTMNIKTLVFDIDGTLCKESNQISPLMRKTLWNLEKDKGISIILASGRPYYDIQAFMQENQLHCSSIMMNGAAMCTTSGDIIMEKRIPSYIVNQVIELLASLSVPTAIFFSKDAQYKDENFIKETIRFYGYNQEIDAYISQMHKVNQFKTENVLKIECIITNNIDKQKVIDLLKRIPNLHVTSSMGWNIEITNGDATKGNTLKQYLTSINIKDEECYIFGDSENDLSMFEQFTNTVLVKNHNDHLIGRTKYYVDSCEQDGVAKFLISVFRIENINTD